MKEFDAWNEQKKILDNSNSHFFFRTGEVWWCSVGLNIGDESFGKGETFRRPVLVLKKLSDKSFIGIPLSSKRKTGSWFFDIVLNKQTRTALLYQIRMFSTNRFQRKISTLSAEDFNHIQQKLKQLLELL